MELQQKIENLIEKIRLVMPSSGLWPFTVISLSRDELKDLSFRPSALLSSKQLLFLRRTDFYISDLIDYISNTDEFFSIPLDQREDFLKHYIERIMGESGIVDWCKKITSLSIGIAIQLSENLDLCIEPIEGNLAELDDHFQFSNQNLKCFQLFDIYAC